MNELYCSPEAEQQRELLYELQKPQPTVIGIEGGPCGGKTTLVEYLQSQETNRPIVVLPEAATLHIEKLQTLGLSVPDMAQNHREGFLAFEADVLNTIVQQIDEAKEAYKNTNAIIVADRCDIGAYVTADEYSQICSSIGLESTPLVSRVDQLYYLPSVAQTNPDKYDQLKLSNTSRYESLEGAQSTCQANLDAVAHHPEIHIAWGGDFDATIKNLGDSILSPEKEAEAKFTIVSEISLGKLLKDCQRFPRSYITQSYHKIDELSFRLRTTQTGTGETVYSFAIKTGEGVMRHEVQRILSADQFALLASVEQEGGTIEKYRYPLLVNEGPTKRLWSVDEHFDERLPKFVLETDVYSEQQAWELALLHGEYFNVSSVGSQQLARLLSEE